MKKADLLKVKLPDLYQDCSEWFEDGLDNIPSLLDFLQAGKDKREYEKLQQLYVIENMKKYVKEAVGEDEAELEKANVLIEEEIRKYNKK